MVPASTGEHGRHDETVTHWINGLKQSDPGATGKLWKRYFRQLVALARRRLGTRHPRLADEEDVAVSVFKSLCLGAAKGRFDKLRNRDDLWRILLAVTHRKAVEQHRRETRVKRGGNSQAGVEEVDFEQVPDPQPTPEFLAALNEQHGRLLAVLRNDSLREIALSKLRGDTTEEIAAQLDISSRSVERKVRLIRETWARELRNASH